MPEFKKEGRGFKMKGFTPFTQMHDHQLAMMQHRQQIDLRQRDEENKDELLEKAKGSYIKKAQRKEKKAAKRTEQGRDRSAARKLRKAGKLRDQASKLTADEVVSRRAMMRMSSPMHQNDDKTKKEVKIPKKETGSNPPAIDRMLKEFEKLEANKNKTPKQKEKIDSLGRRLDNYYQDDNRG